MTEAAVGTPDPAVLAGHDVQDPDELRAELVEACVGRLGLEGALVCSVTADGLRPTGASDDGARVLGLLQNHLREGPALDAWRTGSVVAAPDPAHLRALWPRLAPELEHRGVSAAYAVPLHDPMQAECPVTHVLVLLAGRALTDSEVALAQVLAGLVTARIDLVAELQVLRRRTQELQAALDSRVLIEQAKGVVAEQRGVDVDRAFELLRTRARTSGVRLRELADLVVRRRVDLDVAAAELSRSTPRRPAGSVPGQRATPGRSRR